MSCPSCGMAHSAGFSVVIGRCPYCKFSFNDFRNKIPDHEAVLRNLIDQKDARIAELEAELHEMREATKQRYKTTIKVQTALEAEEGEG